MHRALALLALAFVTLVASAAAGAESSARLVFVRDAPAATACEDESSLRRAVESRLGYDPFSPWASDTVVVRFEREETGFAARVERVAGGVSKGARTLRVDDPRCGGLVEAAALAVTIALDAMHPAVRQAPADASPTPAAPPEPPEPSHAAMAVPRDGPSPDTLASAPPRLRWRPVVGLDALGSIDSAPSLSAGFAGWGRLGTDCWSMGLEARADLPSTGAGARVGSVSSWLAAGGFSPCVHFGALFGCAVGQLGLLHASGEGVTTPRDGSGVFAAVGPRVGIEVPVGQLVAIRLRADLLANLARMTVELNGAPAWQAPTATGTLAAGIALRIP